MPDGTETPVASGDAPMDVAKRISPRLADDAVVARGRTRGELRQELKRATEQLISENWPFVVAVAAEALRKEVLLQDIERIRETVLRRK